MKLAFPKRCENCGRIYGSLEDFITSTEALQGTAGLQEYPDGDGEYIVGLYRNCACHSTLVALCENRRDVSPEGEERRRQFDALLDGFVAHGLSRETVRVELRKLLRGQKSPLLAEKCGFTPEKLQGSFAKGN